MVGLDRREGSYWFNSEVVRKVGNGNKTSFWNHVWLGNETLRSSYPRLYDISNQKDMCVGEMREVAGGLGGVGFLCGRKIVLRTCW